MKAVITAATALVLGSLALTGVAEAAGSPSAASAVSSGSSSSSDPTGDTSPSASDSSSPSTSQGHLTFDPVTAQAGGIVRLNGTCPENATAVISISSAAFTNGTATLEKTDPQAFTATAHVLGDASPQEYAVSVKCTVAGGSFTFTTPLPVKGGTTAPSSSGSPGSSASATVSSSSSHTSEVSATPSGAPNTGAVGGSASGPGPLIAGIGLGSGALATGLAVRARRRARP